MKFKVFNLEQVNWEIVYDHFFIAESKKWFESFGAKQKIKYMSTTKRQFMNCIQWHSGTLKVEDLLQLYIHPSAGWLKQLSCHHKVIPCSDCKGDKRTFKDFSENYEKYIGKSDLNGERKLNRLKQLATVDLLHNPRIIILAGKKGAFVLEGNSRLSAMIMAKGITGWTIPIFFGETIIKY
ncbi:hypothetical protein [Priestia megaterium]|uniref:Uncharacterized protein n=1 Tax=Priestia megaterium TaxID=1404 RepID=A0A6M6E6H4_PRIMG|nr:hypothetical protein [Priestia megaterium]QJX80127.1 hypothetical protein FDZ14_28945 [Priestia megaterium]